DAGCRARALGTSDAGDDRGPRPAVEPDPAGPRRPARRPGPRVRGGSGCLRRHSRPARFRKRGPTAAGAGRRPDAAQPRPRRPRRRRAGRWRLDGLDRRGASGLHRGGRTGRRGARRRVRGRAGVAGARLRRAVPAPLALRPDGHAPGAIRLMDPALFLADLEARPESLARLADGFRAGDPLADVPASPRRVLLVGMGSSRYAAVDAALRLRAEDIDAVADYASATLRWAAPPPPPPRPWPPSRGAARRRRRSRPSTGTAACRGSSPSPTRRDPRSPRSR